MATPPDEPTDTTTTEYDQAPPSNTSLVRRDFAGVSMAAQNAAIESMVAKERAMIEARWTMALHRPRNLDNVRVDILKECRRPGFAEVAVYARPVGRKYNETTKQWEQAFAEGLSIRFAEVAVRCMKNIYVETPTIHEGDTDKLVRVVVTDFESNATWSRDLSVKKTVERKSLKKDQKPIGQRVNSYGDRVFIVEATDDEVAVKEAALVSKAARTLVLRLIPGHIQDEALDLCKEIAAKKDAADPDAARKRMFDAFSKLAVKPSDIELYVGHSTETLSPAEIDHLRKLHAAIHEGEITWQAALDAALDGREKKPDAPTTDTKIAEAPAAKKGTAAVKDAIKKTDSKKPDAPTAAPAATTAPVEKSAPAPAAHPVALMHRCPRCGVPCVPPGICEACSKE